TPSSTAIKPPDLLSATISAIAVGTGNSGVIWVGHDDGDIYFTTNGTAASPSWTQSGNPTGRLPTRIAIPPGDSRRIYVTFGGFEANNVWRTSDGGATWENITGNLPAAPVNSIVVSPLDTNTLYVGTEVG